MFKQQAISDRRATRVLDQVRRMLQRSVSKTVSTVKELPITTQPDVEPQSDWPSLDEVHDAVKSSIDAQNDRLKSVDTKANFGLASASLLTAGVTGVARALSDSAGSVSQSHELFGVKATVGEVVDWITIASLGFYALIVICTFMAYRLRDFDESPDPMRLVEEYVGKSPSETKAAITMQRAKNFNVNEKVINRKAKWASVAMVLLIIEACLLVTTALVQAKWL